MKNIELLITNNLGNSTAVDLLNEPFRLNRTVFTTSEDRLKTLGGATSTKITLAKSKRNNRLFFGKSTFSDYNKFNNGQVFKAVMTVNGSQVLRGTFSLDKVTAKQYEGTFYAEDIDWVQSLADVKLNELDYVDGKPTWLVPFDGAITFNQVNQLTNNDTDFICPTIVYNNTPIADYLDLTDEEVWGTFDMTDPNNPKRLTPAFSPNDFVCTPGLFYPRLGLTYDSFPPAVNYKNLIERVFRNIGVDIACPLFAEDWFNAIYLPYVGGGYVYNWKNIASIHLFNEQVNQEGEDTFDDLIILEGDTPTETNQIAVNYADLPLFGGGSGTRRWIEEPFYRFNRTNIIKHDDWQNPNTIDKITAYNKFNIEGQYICPTDGEYTIKVDTDYSSGLVDDIQVYSGGPGGAIIWNGASLINNLGSWDANSTDPNFNNRHYAWDDQVLVVRRYNEAGKEVYTNTDEMLYRWMNGENKDFINDPSDVIAYFSPKRKYINDNVTPLSENEYKGSPLTNFTSEVVLNSSSHTLDSSFAPKEATSACDIEVTLDLRKNERIVIYWTSIANIRGIVQLNPSLPKPIEDAYESSTNFVLLNESNLNDLEITYNCGEYDLDLAQNLPNITCKEFISSFIKQFNLYVDYTNGKLTFLPQAAFFSPNTYDVTSRIEEDSWESEPLPAPKSWQIGYTLDDKDRLLNVDTNKCNSTISNTNNYGNLQFDNPNATSEKILNDFNMFSSTRFITGDVALQDISSGSPITFPLTTPDPVSGVQIYKGISPNSSADVGIFTEVLFPSIQSQESFDQRRLGDLTYDYNYKPRLFYHLGVLNDFIPLTDDWQVLVDSPRPDSNFVVEQKHWFRPTLSQFHYENSILTGIGYPSLRYDRTAEDDGLYIKYFEDLISLYNESEMFTLVAALRTIDWNNMTGSLRIKYRDQVYRLSQIIDFDPEQNNNCKIKMIKEI